MSDPTLSDPTFIEMAKWTVICVGGSGLATASAVFVKRLLNKMDKNGNGGPHPSRRKEDLWMETVFKMQGDSIKAMTDMLNAMNNMLHQLEMNGSEIKESGRLLSAAIREFKDQIIAASRCNYKDKPKHGREGGESHG